MMPQIIQLFVQFLQRDVPSIARDAKVDRVDAVAEAMFDGLFFGTTFQSEAARRRRPRGALREQEDEDAQGHGAGPQATASKELPPGGAPAVCSASSSVKLGV